MSAWCTDCGRAIVGQGRRVTSADLIDHRERDQALTIANYAAVQPLLRREIDAAEAANRLGRIKRAYGYAD